MKKKYAMVLAVILFSACQSDKISDQRIEKVIRVRNIQMKNLLGINAFEWDFLQNHDEPGVNTKMYEPKFELIKSFGMVRHYLDWEKLEDKKGKYSFNPTARGGWNYDVIYERCKKEGIDVLVCMKSTPDWLYLTYPKAEQDYDHVPVPYKANREDPNSYISQARTAFQFAARYGSNKDLDPALVKVNLEKRWPDDVLNTVKIGLNTIKYFECNNEPDKWWKGPKARQTGREYAANLSAFYDGHKGTMGKGVGVKNADSNMVVVMGGLGRPDIEYLKEMVEWCKEKRGYKADGTIDLCFDVINYHLYSNDNTGWFGRFVNKKRGVAPELTNQGEIANTFVDFAEMLRKNFEVWVTESGYDLNTSSVQRAVPVGSKSALITQADWMLRSSLLYARHGVNRSCYYQLYDTDPKNGVFGSAGFVDNGKRRPVADYFLQVKKLMGNFFYFNTINDDPIVDIYRSGKKSIYILTVPDEVDRKEKYKLDLNGAKTAIIYTLIPGADEMQAKEVKTNNGFLEITVTETPVFVEGR
ncbi:hypothetical protein HDC92_000023 [Pedobacter sp. AK017]|uniref:hypothetical protein n=1 Tax=Pedobacter sp. AK017 TaxID=2723073 RepID=UPI001617CCF2|nr:hypothetical protein [Pedobacter sp. AK017]MBB5436359.1 hypothetical protein [Pedobacter sp. AK017]